MKKVKMIMILILISLLVFSCFQEEDSDFPYDVTAFFSQDSVSAEENIIIFIRTDNSFSNCNYGIIYDSSVNNREISIEFTGIYIPEIVLPACGPASAYVGLQLTDRTGTYNIRFENQGIENTAELVFNDEMCILETVNTTNVTVLKDTLYLK
ncbi:MAG: hypothetical protein DRP93_01275 [Candidatus Neomarinimicrobiota bacterium]|nr:MAG: hypothetical protein DRP93_01275 [Candidatus Neomarinimicrobiota bacterium]